MNSNEIVDLDISIDELDYRSLEISAALSDASKKLNMVREEIAKLKGLSENSRSKLYSRNGFKQDLQVFIYIIPASIRDRMIMFANNLEENEEGFLSNLCQEAYALLLYDAIISEIEDVHDLSNPVLSSVIRSCIDNHGTIPVKSNAAFFLRIQPNLLSDIEDAYQKHRVIS